MFLEINELNGIAILFGGLLYMLYGGMYYSILLGKKKEAGSQGPFKYMFSVVTAFISSFLVSILINAAGVENFIEGTVTGLMIGLLISLVYIKNSLFGLLTKKSCIIAIGDHFVIFTLLGMLHGFMN
ncbi:DUF1761 domain-containing protein [Fictibacillus sp. BK138]|uniref:DUF1761 domain-containing protein n=1 Tax=Fictibacillus sp. BK138 TaxID=2512121 RepID=UPI001029099C|nr:DUF1761 domain-containing protein [Fictibacillus sp. BK138]RZT21019.1 uncharacterized protein DUF1761 [Fictibacillus sp. BK138]